MTEYVGQWMRSVAGAALICGAALALIPKGKVRAVTQLVCGLVMISALLSPLMAGSEATLSMNLSEYRTQAAELAQDGQKNSERLSRTIIEQELSAYILDKARSLGEELTAAELTMRWSSEGCWYPESVSLKGDVSSASREKLSGIIEAELGIPAQKQYWSENES